MIGHGLRKIDSENRAVDRAEGEYQVVICTALSLELAFG